MDRNLFRKNVKWLGLLIIAHVVAMIIFGLAFSSSLAHMSEDQPTRAKILVLAYNIVFDTLFVLIFSKGEMSYIEYRKSIKEAIKTKSFTVLKHFKTVMLKEHLSKLGVFMAFQIPFVIFFSILGLSLQNPSIFEQFYYMDAGCYILTNSAILGWILNTLLFGFICTLVRILLVFLTKKDLEKDICT